MTLFLLDKKNYLNSVFATGVEGDGLHFSTRGERAGLAAVAAREDRPVRAIDAYQERSFNPVIDHETGFRTRSVLALPLHDTAGGVLGVLELLNKTALDGDAAAFTPQEQEALMVVASHCSHAIENIRLQATQLEMLQTRAQEVVRRGSCCGQEHAAAMAAAEVEDHSGGLVVSARPAVGRRRRAAARAVDGARPRPRAARESVLSGLVQIRYRFDGGAGLEQLQQQRRRCSQRRTSSFPPSRQLLAGRCRSLAAPTSSARARNSSARSSTTSRSATPARSFRTPST